MNSLQGVGASSGVAIGPPVLLVDEEFVVPDVADPMGSLGAACSAVSAELTRLSEDAESLGRQDAAEVLAAQSLMAQDPMIVDAVESRVGNATFDAALNEASSELQAMLAGLPDPYLAARAADVGEVFDRVRRFLAGRPTNAGPTLEQPSILCAATLTAAQTALLDPSLVSGLATVDGGPTSHVAIIARSLGVPAVVGLEGLVEAVRAGEMLAIDGTSGELVVDPDPEQLEEFERRLVVAKRRAAAADLFRGRKVAVADTTIHVAANVANETDLERAVEVAADGIGLFRTEFLYLDQPNPPAEDAQVELYSRALRSFAEPVVVRTFDIGGDKPADFLNLPPEENPFLGVRGVRLYQHTPELFMTQVRALLRAATAGDLWVMIPMIATVSEVVWVEEQFERARTDLRAEGVEVGRISLGAMVEVPSAALLADALAERLDFLSIGTNDLTQYTLAADRTNGSVDDLSDPLHPAVIRLCRMTAEAGQRLGTPVSVCGLAAADPVAATLFVEMGVTKLSVAAPSVNAIKAEVDRMTPATVRDVAEAVEKATDGPEVRQLAASFEQPG